jgi:hypothetical protein
MITIEVKRNRPSVTQGSADVYINGEKVITFGDDIYMQNKDGTFTNGHNTIENAKFYGEIIGGWGSIKPDSDFIFGLFYHPYDNIYHYSELAGKAILKADN